MKDSNLHKAVMGVLLGKKPVEEAKIKHPNQQAIDVHEPEEDEITADDFKKLRSMKKDKNGKLHNCATHIEHSLYGAGQCIKEAHADPDENGDISWYTVQFEDGSVRKVQTESMKIIASESHKHESVEVEGSSLEETLDEARFEKGQDIGKPGMNFKKIAMKAAAKYGSAEAGKRVAGAVLNKVLAKEEVEEQVHETTVLHDAFTVEIKESYSFGEYLSTAKKLVGEEKAIDLANRAYRDQDVSIFVEEYSQSAVEDKVKAHAAAGHTVSMPKYITRDGKPRAEYIVTDKETGVRRKYIHQGNVVKMENMGAKGKKD